MKQRKKWLSDYSDEATKTENFDAELVSAREIIRKKQEQTQELRAFLKCVSQTRRSEREPYVEIAKTKK